ncbi:hypothetical protein NDU88_012568 [Pleurodeles waltl]|uniref:Uncharacterized protein n=1 Tax=Pleurodeles waltl TaxID=8319 RepID=A0AAV7R473_PLEWA|nr:hypothetical protein NDU88_012568 [Pleurodeles waltl]
MKTPARPEGPRLSVVWDEAVRYETPAPPWGPGLSVSGVEAVRNKNSSMCRLSVEDPGCLWFEGEPVRYENSCTTRRTRAVCGSRVNLCVMKTPAPPWGPGLSVVWGKAVPYETPARPGGPGLSVSWDEAVRNKNSPVFTTCAVCGVRANLGVMKTPARPGGPGLSVAWDEAVPYETPARPGGPGLSVVWCEAVRYENSWTTRRTRAVCGSRANMCVMKTPARPGGPGLSVVRGGTCAL